MSALLTYALDENKKLVHINTVEKGGACRCVCPHCNKPVDAKNGGEIREHHFAHSHGNTCEGAYETALHMLAKEILKEEQCVMLPPSKNKKYPSGLVKLHNVELEKWDNEFGFRPDIEGIMDNGERLLIEILVSHKVQKKKHDAILNNGLKCIEIDLNYVELDKSAIRSFLLEDMEDRHWINEYESKPVGNGEGSGIKYQRNKSQIEAIDLLKEKFENETLTLSFWYGDYDVKQLGYDVCEPLSRNFRGLKSDLLLFRSGKEDKGYIAISIRGRRRNFNQKLPKNLRMIDIIVRNDMDVFWLSEQNFLRNDNDRVIFEGFKNKESVYEGTDNPLPAHSIGWNYASM